MSLPGNQHKLEIVAALEALAKQAGLSLIELAVGFVLEHPAVTAPIIGPRTPDHLEALLSTSEIALGIDVLDRIDEIVPPGVTLHGADAGWQPPALVDSSQRRRRRA
jgi:aryl-alcohol dehydrogenase-like predicted oxidoreductase